MTEAISSATLREVAPALQADMPADGAIVWNLSLEDIESVSGRVLRRTTCRVADLGSTKCAFDTRHVLYSKLRPYLNKVVVPDSSGVGTSELIPLLPDPTRLDREYLAFYLRSPGFVDFATSVMQGANLPRVSMTDLWKHQLHFPRLQRQQHIVARIKQCLTRVDEMQSVRETAQTEMDVLPAAAMREAWQTDEITVASSHKLDELGDITTGNTPSRKVPEFFAEFGVPWITPGDMNGVKDITSGREFLSPKGIKEGRARVVAPNTVIVCCIGATIGKVAIVRQPTGINQQINAITFGARIWPDYGYWACRALYPHILANAAQATLPILNKSRFGELAIPVPPIETQKRLASRLNKVLAISLQLRQAAQQSEAEEHALRKSILREAFAGNL